MSRPITPNELKRFFPGATKSAQAVNPGLRPADEERAEGIPLERAGKREDPSRTRLEICFTVYSRGGADWDNPYTKAVQDLLIRAGILHGDEWDVLQGKVISEKVHTEAEEKTTIEIYPVL